MNSALFKQPRMVIFWIVLAGGAAVVLTELAGLDSGGIISTLARTVFWGAAIAYLGLRVYQVATSRKSKDA